MAGNRNSGLSKKSFRTSRIRDYDDPLYMFWRRAVRERDGFVCQMPNCNYKHHTVQIHHIKPWKQFPTLRYTVSNGICLCPSCHRKVTGQEIIFEPVFVGIVMKNTILWEERKKKCVKKRKVKYG